MEAAMSIRSLSHHPISNPRGAFLVQENACFFLRGLPLNSNRRTSKQHQQRRSLLVVEAKSRKGKMSSMTGYQPRPLPQPKIEDDGNPHFVLFIRPSHLRVWWPTAMVTGGTAEKIMVAAKDNFLGKYAYKDTIARKLGATIYKNEKQMKKAALAQHPALRSTKSFRYGYKLVENRNVKAAMCTNDVTELPPEEELKTVVDKVKDFFGNATSDVKESFGKLTSLGSFTKEESE